MIKAVFFDLYHTLVGFDPPREELQAEAMKDRGIDIKPEVLRRPLFVADEYIYQEIARCPLSKRSEEEKMALWMQYQRVLLGEAGVDASEQVVRGLLGNMMKADMKLVPFDDVVPVLTDLMSRGLTLGLISNVEKDITSLLDNLGLLPLLPVVVTSLDTGYSKPQPEIFQAALKKAGIEASEAIYVGDQLQVDIGGANGAGLKGVLLDRGGYTEETADCPLIRSLSQIVEYL